jgi:DNA-binding CsgD family transcriptional regulator
MNQAFAICRLPMASGCGASESAGFSKWSLVSQPLSATTSACVRETASSTRVDAREQLRRAHETFSGIGALAFAERAGRELAATGEVVPRRANETRDHLTAQEARIARLAAAGHTNPEIGERLFISPRTVEYHLRKVFTKLEISSRRELRAALPEDQPALTAY